ncbi:ABC transporter substrate-binding protein [Cohnella silvisoli]|uniref:Extracellular solute-binding protein n=1 Tax=Cohnella silvisoli TaxID=2873699 RepID=A0ABV1KTF1_9BACL|nr:extracellular solute-binding protein [Cohnella silvisoli]MCD9021508.1 extracellular solute-binding protein [Cohnella silvisoli]
MLKKMGVQLFACLLIVSLIAGCGSNSNTSSSPEKTNEASSSGTPAESGTAESKNDEAFTITVSSWNLADEPLGIVKAYRETFEAIYKEKYPNAKIEYLNTPSDKYFDVLKAQMASASAADVVQLQWTQIPLFAKAGYLTDLSDMPFVASIDGSAKIQSTYKGAIYAAPFDISTNGVWYNRKLFADNNMTPPKSWDELLQIAETFKTQGITPFAGGFKDGWVAGMTVSVFTPNEYGSDSFELDVYNGKKKVNGPEIQAAFQKLQLLYEKGYFGPDALSNGWDLQRKLFEDGKAAMIIHGSYIAGLVNSEMKDKGGMETGFFALPHDKGGPVLSVGSGVLTAVNAKTKDVQRAKDLVTAMYDPKAQIVRDKDSGTFPAMKGIDIDYKEIGNKDFLQVVGSTKSVIAGRYLPPSTGDIFTKIFTKILAGKKFEPKWLDEVDRALEQDKALINPPE